MTCLPKAASTLAGKFASRCPETVAVESVLGLIVNAWTFLGSFLVCVAVYRNVRLRTIANMYILSLAFIDLLMAVLVMPFSLAATLKGEWVSTSSACQFQGYMTLVLGCLTMLTMTLMAIDRYFATARPVQYTYFFKRKSVGCVIALCWFLAFAVSLCYSISGSAYAFHPGTAACGMDLTKGDATYQPAALLELFFVVIPLLIMAFCYWRVHVRIGSNRETKTTLFDEEEDTTKVFSGMVVGVLTFWSPFFLVNIIDVSTAQYGLPRAIYFACSLCIGISCCIKPHIICNFDVDFKAEFKRILACRRTRRVADSNAGATKHKSKTTENPKGAPEKRRYLMEEEPKEKTPSYDIVQVHHTENPKPKRTPEGRETGFSGGEVEMFQEVDTLHTDGPPMADSTRFFLDEETDGRESRLKTAEKQQQQRQAQGRGAAGLPPVRSVVFEERAEEIPLGRGANGVAYPLTEEKPQRKKKYRKKRSDTTIPSRKNLSDL